MANHAKKKSDLTEDLMPFAEIGRRLGIPEKTAAQICRRAMKKIQKLLAEKRYSYIDEFIREN